MCLFYKKNLTYILFKRQQSWTFDPIERWTQNSIKENDALKIQSTLFLCKNFILLTYQMIILYRNSKILLLKSYITGKSCLSKFETFYGMNHLRWLLRGCLVILPMNCTIYIASLYECILYIWQMYSTYNFISWRVTSKFVLVYVINKLFICLLLAYNGASNS